ncbi:MAG: proline--tRNA ligase, partial [Spirochaetia bacterium]|nr:proline--tRNA ligase [Spirochaetia bacterium]
MKASSYLLSTLREDPQDAVLISHKLMLRAGLIKKVGSGLYHILPMGLRVLRKVEGIIREEMNAAGAVEFLLPILTPGELWEKSGRWEGMGKEMFRLKDRHDTWNVLGPTHEEAFTSLMADLLKSYRDLPKNVYQMHTKFRDEIRPRFGVMRSREFVMKDAYSFDLDETGLDVSYQTMRQTYRKIFSRAGLKTLPVDADTGAIGGSASEEFMVPSEVGEDVILVSEKEKYRGNQEKTPVIYKEKKASPEKSEKKAEKIHTPGVKTIEDLADFLKAKPEEILKSVLFKSDGESVLVCL